MDIKQRLLQQQEALVEATQALIKIKSVKETVLPNKPFGEGINEALEFFLAEAQKLGFKTTNVDGYAGIVEYGEGEETLGILAHLDVVPEGTGWDYDPYGAEIVNGKMYGRGTIDDKGPAMAALYALNAIKDENIKTNKKIKLIVGTDEESGSEGLKYLFKKHPKPQWGISPDGQYPVIYAEKGITHASIKKKLTNNQNLFVSGGLRVNMVPEQCDCKADKMLLHQLADYAEKKQYEYQLKDNVFSIIGKSAHGSTPEKGINACLRMLNLLSDCCGEDVNNSVVSFIQVIHGAFKLETNGESVGLNMSDQESGELTLNVGCLRIDETEALVQIDIRYPVTVEKEVVDEVLTSFSKQNELDYQIEKHAAPLHIPKDSEFIQTLLRVYQKHTGDLSEPIAIGGGTYARELDYAVAFGAMFPTDEDVMHQKNEYIELKTLYKNCEIYADAIIALTTE